MFAAAKSVSGAMGGAEGELTWLGGVAQGGDADMLYHCVMCCHFNVSLHVGHRTHQSRLLEPGSAVWPCAAVWNLRLLQSCCRLPPGQTKLQCAHYSAEHQILHALHTDINASKHCIARVRLHIYPILQHAKVHAVLTDWLQILQHCSPADTQHQNSLSWRTFKLNLPEFTAFLFPDYPWNVDV